MSLSKNTLYPTKLSVLPMKALKITHFMLFAIPNSKSAYQNQVIGLIWKSIFLYCFPAKNGPSTLLQKKAIWYIFAHF